MKTLFWWLLLAASWLLIAGSFVRPVFASKDAVSVERGRYLVRIAGCNDCHTAGYAEQGGNVPEAQWLLGDQLGWRGPWGTTYAINLRLYFSRMTEDQWLSVARQLRSRPPMPYFNIAAMDDDDLRSLYRFVRLLEPLGKPVPAYLPPTKEPPQPYVQFP